MTTNRHRTLTYRPVTVDGMLMQLMVVSPRYSHCMHVPDVTEHDDEVDDWPLPLHAVESRMRQDQYNSGVAFTGTYTEVK